MGKREAEMFHKQGMSCLGQDKVRESLEFFNKAIKFDYDYFPAWNNKGIVLLELKEYEQALNCFEQVIRINPMDKMVRYNKGYVALLLEKYPEAVEAFEHFRFNYSKKDDDFYKFALYLQAKGLYGLKEYDKALELTKDALKIDENFIEAQELLNLILKDTKKKE